MKEGDTLPEFQIMSTIGKEKTNEDFIGNATLFFIYSKNDTNSCTKEAKSFSDAKQKFLDLGIKIYGVSKDTIESHKKFKTKHALDIELLSDSKLHFITAIGAWVEKSMYGKKYIGVDRSTFLINSKGLVVKEWRSVKVKGHVLEVLQALKEI